MKPILLLVSAIVLDSSILAAQKTVVTGPDGTSIVTETRTDASGHVSSYTIITFGPCPVRMQARHGSGYGLVMTRGRQSPDSGRDTIKDSQTVHLILEGGQQTIHSAKVRVLGRTDRARIDRTEHRTDTDFDIKRTLDIIVSNQADGTSTSDLILPGFTMVGRIELLSFTYADGTQWRVGSHSACTVSPDPYMLVADP